MHIGWPQGIWLGLAALSVLVHAGKDGEPRNEKYNFGLQLCSAMITFGLLYWGGFFNAG